MLTFIIIAIFDMHQRKRNQDAYTRPDTDGVWHQKPSMTEPETIVEGGRCAKN